MRHLTRGIHYESRSAHEVVSNKTPGGSRQKRSTGSGSCDLKAVHVESTAIISELRCSRWSFAAKRVPGGWTERPSNRCVMRHVSDQHTALMYCRTRRLRCSCLVKCGHVADPSARLFINAKGTWALSYRHAHGRAAFVLCPLSREAIGNQFCELLSVDRQCPRSVCHHARPDIVSCRRSSAFMNQACRLVNKIELPMIVENYLRVQQAQHGTCTSFDIRSSA